MAGKYYFLSSCYLFSPISDSEFELAVSSTPGNLQLLRMMESEASPENGNENDGALGIVAIERLTPNLHWLSSRPGNLQPLQATETAAQGDSRLSDVVVESSARRDPSDPSDGSNLSDVVVESSHEETAQAAPAAYPEEPSDGSNLSDVVVESSHEETAQAAPAAYPEEASDVAEKGDSRLSDDEANVSDLISSFVDHMTSLDGGSYAGKSAKESGSRVRKMLSSLGGIGGVKNNLASLVHQGGYIHALRATRYPSTIYNHMLDLDKFLKYCCSLDGDPIDMSVADIQKLRERVHNWRRALRKDLSVRRMDLLFAQQSVVDELSPALAEVAKHPSIRHAYEILKDPRNSVSPTAKTLRTVRDALMCDLLVSNVQRSGAVAEMTIDNYKTCSSPIDGEYVITVSIFYSTPEKRTHSCRHGT
jgi:hypothetical protein